MNPLREVIDFFNAPVRPQVVGRFRFLLCSVLLADILFTLAPDRHVWLGPDGLLPASAGDWWIEEQGRFDLLRHPLGWPWLSSVLPDSWNRSWAAWGETSTAVELLFALWVAAVALAAAGLRTRTALAAAWMLTLTFQHSLAWITNGADRLFAVGLFLLLFADAGNAWSLDALIRRRRSPVSARPASAWPLRLMQIQLCLVYCFTALSKIDLDAPGGGDWVTGDAVGWVLSDIVLARVPSERLPLPLWTLRLATWGSLAFELAFPLLMCFRRTRRLALAAGSFMHAGVYALVEVGSFSPAVLCWYVLMTPARTDANPHGANPHDANRDADQA